MLKIKVINKGERKKLSTSIKPYHINYQTITQYYIQDISTL